MTLDVDRLVLVRGSNEAGAGFSAMEAVAFAAGEAWSERPRCASPTITEWMIAWNDGLDDRSRQELRRYIWRLVGSKGTPAQERARRWMAGDWLARAYAPAWLNAAGLVHEARGLAALPPLRGPRDVADAGPAATAAARAARGARDDAWRRAAETAAGMFDWGTAGAVWSAISDATWAAAGSAARAVVWSSTDAMGPGAASTGAGEGVWDIVSDAAADAAGAMAWRAIQRVVRDEGDLWTAAWDTACDALAPTGGALQASAHVVVDRMLAVTEAHNPTARPFDLPHPRRLHRGVSRRPRRR
jgi:hypothetical protein